ncbi:AMIN domain-containing protein [Phormidium sp. LEGE 05292]|uniref:AMIN domain-containing protein n=1 Tax=[Phormidium] sp. LEGE 05292 TaxID=767427 RepID=UPI0018823814|nr:type IV pilus secretin family protein [Phormidium sp. LEGE 05292]MBE9225816.1 AMIN domain-containing protein [Phormidium sp. LEGE 05292]
MKYNQGLGGLLFGGTAVLLATQPVWAAPTQVTGVRVQPVGNSIQVILDTKEGDRPQIFTVNRQNVFVADITNTQLRLPQGQQFNQQNPAPGIAAVTVTQLAPNSIRLQVVGANATPTGEVTAKQSEGITFNLNLGGGSAAAAPRTPNVTPAPNNSPVTAQLPANQTPLVPTPTITYEGGPAPAAGVVQPVSPAPPFLPRAVAPPVGDIAVSEVNSAASTIDLGTAERVPRLLLRDAPAREVLSLLARAANRNVVFLTTQTGTPGQQGQQQPGQQGAAATSLDAPISLDIENEPLQDVFNYVLRITGLQANRNGNTIFVGTNLPEAASNIIVRSLRLNQVPAATAANFLTAQGAETQLPIERVQINTIGEGAAARTVEIREPDIKVLRAQRGVGPLVLSGLSVLTNERLNSITLVGDPRKVEIATAFLSQLDARRRQVAVNVKIIDVNLNNSDFAGASFSFGVGNTFFTFDNGAAAIGFGPYRPPTIDQSAGSQFNPPVIGDQDLYPPNTFSDPAPFLDAQQNAPYSRNSGSPLTTGRPDFPGYLPRAPFGTNNNPLQPGVVSIDPTTGRPTVGLPQLFQFPSQFLGYLRAQIVSGNAKILTDPTLVIQEGETAKVSLGQEVISNQQVQTQPGSPPTTTVTTEKETAGLNLSVQIERIDDNGFVTLIVNPSISAPASQVQIGSGVNSTTITLLNRRDVSSGRVRLRDAQTLILSGIIQDADRTTVRKVPLLGDIPILGALFRSTTRQNNRNEVIVMLTPQIVDDSGNAPFGYRYRPSPEVQQLLRQRGFTPPSNNPQP